MRRGDRPHRPSHPTAGPWTRDRAATETSTASRRLATACLALAALGAVACDAAFDGAYAGRPLAVWRASVVHPTALDPAVAAATGGLRFALVWSVPGGAPRVDSLAAGALSRAESLPDEAAVAIHAPPPDVAERAVAVGRFAVGQMVVYADLDGDLRLGASEPLVGASPWLVAWSAAGAVGPPLALPLAPGFQRVRASGPCDSDARALAYVPVPDDEPGRVVVGAPFGVDEAFSGGGCLAAKARAVASDTCPVFEVVRWLCRWSRGGDPTLCARCEADLFPEGAPAEVCDAWRERCTTLDVHGAPDPVLCADEWRLCRLGEPVRAEPCDLACACDAALELCLAEGSGEAVCQAKRASCDWLAPAFRASRR